MRGLVADQVHLRTHCVHGSRTPKAEFPPDAESYVQEGVKLLKTGLTQVITCSRKLAHSCEMYQSIQKTSYQTSAHLGSGDSAPAQLLLLQPRGEGHLGEGVKGAARRRRLENEFYDV